jgi:hypothetical protein
MSRAVLTAVLLFPALALAAPAQPPAPLLPHAFAGWTEVSSATVAPASANAAILAEDGLTQSETAVYASGGNRLTVRAWRFKDATGAYGAFTFFRPAGSREQDIGHADALSGNHFLVWRGVTLLDATFAHSSAANQSALSALAALMPKIYGADGVPPSLPNFLPKDQLDPSSIRYAIGPAAFAQSGSSVALQDVDFPQDTEVVTALYGPSAAQGTLTLILYPTPQIAAAHLASIAKSPALQAKRSGPLLAVLSGHLAAQDAKKTLDAVRFNDLVTINHPEGYVSEAAKLAALLLGIAALTAMLIGASLIVAILLGGGRAMYRVLRGKPASAVAEEEFISLNLGR